MRLMDVQLAFPGILAALVIVTVLGGGLDQVVLAVGIGSIPRYARVLRGSVLTSAINSSSRPREVLAHPIGGSYLPMWAPHAFGTLITLATLGFATAILATASPSFLGLGAQRPTAEWGLMLADGRKYLRIAWWLCVFPGCAVLITAIVVNLFGDGLRDALDPPVG